MSYHHKIILKQTIGTNIKAKIMKDLEENIDYILHS